MISLLSMFCQQFADWKGKEKSEQGKERHGKEMERADNSTAIHVQYIMCNHNLKMIPSLWTN